MTEERGRPGILSLVSTPIGNMEDLSPRMSLTLAEADLVLAEDTRRSAKLLPGSFRGRMASYNDFNSLERLPILREYLEAGKRVALVTDAGTPGISDPCFRAVRLALETGSRVESVPGPCAAVSALVISGLPVDRFFFEGFPPRKAGNRRARLEEVSRYPHTLVFYVGPHHLERFLVELREVLGDREACLAREMTKLHEEVLRGTLTELSKGISGRRIRGEATLVVRGAASGAGFD